MEIKKTKCITPLLLVFIILCSFKGDVKPFKRTDWIPADFDARNGILLVKKASFSVPDKQNEKLTQKMQEIMQEFYPYKFEFASEADILSKDKFTDKNKYRWALVTGTIVRGNAYVGSANSIDFCIYDRMTEKEYKPTGYSNSS